MSDEIIPIQRGPRSALLSATGMAVFLGSWAVSFVALFAMDLLVRARSPAWPPPGLPSVASLLPAWLPAACTLDALVGSLVVQRALGLVRQGRSRRARGWVVVALVLGLGFLAIQTTAWLRVRDAGFAGHHAYYGLFFMLTAFHAAHVLAAAGLLGWLTPAIFRGAYGARNVVPVQHVTWFWHFTTVAWVGTAVLVYVA